MAAAAAAVASGSTSLGMMSGQGQQPFLRMVNNAPGFDQSQFMETRPKMPGFEGIDPYGMAYNNSLGMVRPQGMNQGLMYGLNQMGLSQPNAFPGLTGGAQPNLMFPGMPYQNDLQMQEFFKNNFEGAAAAAAAAGIGFNFPMDKGQGGGMYSNNPMGGYRNPVMGQIDPQMLNPISKQERPITSRLEMSEAQSLRRAGKAYINQLEGMDYLEFDATCIRRFEHEILKNPKLIENYTLLDLVEVKAELEELEGHHGPDPGRFSLEKSDGNISESVTEITREETLRSSKQKAGGQQSDTIVVSDKTPEVTGLKQKTSTGRGEDDTESDDNPQESSASATSLGKGQKKSIDETTVATKSPSEERGDKEPESLSVSRKMSTATDGGKTDNNGSGVKNEEDRVVYHRERKDIERLSGFFLKIAHKYDSEKLYRNIMDHCQSSQEYRTVLESHLSKILTSKQKEYLRKYWLRKFFNFMTKQMAQSEADEKFWAWVTSLNPDNAKSDTRFRSMSNEWLEFMLKYPKFREALRTWLDRFEYRILAEINDVKVKYQKAHAFAKYIRMLILIKNCQDFENRILRDSGYDIPHDFDDGFNKETLRNHTKNGQYPREPFDSCLEAKVKFATCIYRLQPSFKSARIAEIKPDVMFRVSISVSPTTEVHAQVQQEAREEDLKSRLYLISDKYGVSCNDFCDTGDHLSAGTTQNSLTSLPSISQPKTDPFGSLKSLSGGSGVGTGYMQSPESISNAAFLMKSHTMDSDMPSSNLNSGTNSVNILSPVNTPQMTTLLGNMPSDDSLSKEVMMSREKIPGTGDDDVQVIEEVKDQRDSCLESLIQNLRECKKAGISNPNANPIRDYFEAVCENQFHELYDDVRSRKRAYKTQIQCEREDAKKRIKRINENLDLQ